MERKVCTKCKRELTFNNFDKAKNGKNGLKAECKECKKQYYEDNKEILTEKKKQYRQEHLEQSKQYCRENKETLAEYLKQYQKEHLEEYRVRNQRRNARKRLLPSSLTIQQWEEIKEHFNNECAYCGKELPLAQEHVIPLSKGGEYTHNNIICACGSCNSSKGAKLLNDWYPQHEYYSNKRENKILKYLGYTEKGIQQLSIL